MNRKKKWLTKRVTWRKRTVTAQFVHCLYNLFSTLLYNRLYTKLDRRQPPDQGGFRRSYQTLDHPATYKLMEQRFQSMGCQNVDRHG